MSKRKPTEVSLNSRPGVKVRIVRKNSPTRNNYISDNDREMDLRAQEAVKGAIKKATVCGKPIAHYDAKTGKVYIRYADGKDEYIK